MHILGSFRIVWVAALAISLSACMAEERRFDLACSGTTHSRLMGAVEPDAPYSATYRIDLSRSRWCQDDCGASYPIDDASEPKIKLVETGHVFLYFDRPSDTLTDARDLYGRSTKTVARCSRRPFSGIPG